MKPWLGEEEAQAAAAAVASGWVAQGPRVKAFEDAFATRMARSMDWITGGSSRFVPPALSRRRDELHEKSCLSVNHGGNVRVTFDITE